jgi:hypothetical protein
MPSDFLRSEYLPRAYAPSRSYASMATNAPTPLVLAAKKLADQQAMQRQREPQRLVGGLLRTPETEHKRMNLLKQRQHFLMQQEALPLPTYNDITEDPAETQLDILQESLFSEIGAGVVTANSVAHAQALRTLLLMHGASIRVAKLISVLNNVDGALRSIGHIGPVDSKSKVFLDTTLKTLAKVREILQKLVALHSQGLTRRAINQTVASLRTDQTNAALDALSSFQQQGARRITDLEKQKARRLRESLRSSGDSSSGRGDQDDDEDDDDLDGDEDKEEEEDEQVGDDQSGGDDEEGEDEDVHSEDDEQGEDDEQDEDEDDRREADEYQYEGGEEEEGEEEEGEEQEEEQDGAADESAYSRPFIPPPLQLPLDSGFLPRFPTSASRVPLSSARLHTAQRLATPPVFIPENTRALASLPAASLPAASLPGFVEPRFDAAQVQRMQQVQPRTLEEALSYLPSATAASRAVPRARARNSLFSYFLGNNTATPEPYQPTSRLPTPQPQTIQYNTIQPLPRISTPPPPPPAQVAARTASLRARLERAAAEELAANQLAEEQLHLAQQQQQAQIEAALALDAAAIGAPPQYSPSAQSIAAATKKRKGYNAWNAFQAKYRGQGYSIDELRRRFEIAKAQ